MASLDAVKNFAKVTVSIGYDAAATSIALTSGHGAKLPAPATDGAFNVVWWNSTDYSDPSDDPNVEIVRVTARSTDTLTVTRAQESTSATTKNTASKTYKMILGATAKTITDIQTAVQSGSMVYAADAEVSDTYVITLAPVPASLAIGMLITFKANTANTGAATLNVNSLGAITIKKLHDQDLATGDIEAGQLVTVVYDGTNFQMQSQIGQVASSGVTAAYNAQENVTANDALTLVEDMYQPFRDNQAPNVGNGEFGKSTTYQKRSVKFIPGQNCSVSNIHVFLSTTGLPSDNMRLEIQSDTAGSPSGTPITNGTSNTLAGSAIYREDAGTRTNMAYKGHTISFGTAPAVTSGTTYWLVFLRTSTLDDTNYYNTDVFNPGTAIFTGKYYNGTSWTASGGSGQIVPYFRCTLVTGNRVRSAYRAKANEIHLSRVHGFAQATTTAGNSVTLVQSGELTGFSGLVQGMTYFPSATLGAIATTKGQYGGIIGTATSTTALMIDLGHETVAALLNKAGVANTHDYTIRFNIGFIPKKVTILGGSVTGAAGLSQAVIMSASAGSQYWCWNMYDNSGTNSNIQVNFMLYVQNATGGLMSSGTIADQDEYWMDFIITGSAGGTNEVKFIAVAER